MVPATIFRGKLEIRSFKDSMCANKCKKDLGWSINNKKISKVSFAFHHISGEKQIANFIKGRLKFKAEIDSSMHGIIKR